MLELRPGLVDAEWFGLGPHECYPDRLRSGLVGRWESPIDDLFVPYIWPQEAGGRAGVRWLELRDGLGDGVRLTMDEPRQVSANRFRADDLEPAEHLEELVARPETIVHIDAAHRGVGTATCGPDTTEAYRLGGGTYRWAWTLQPLRGGAGSRLLTLAQGLGSTEARISTQGRCGARTHRTGCGLVIFVGIPCVELASRAKSIVKELLSFANATGLA